MSSEPNFPPHLPSSIDGAGSISSGSENTLAGKTVLVTRSAQQSESLCQALESHGASTITFPVIKIVGLEDFSEVDRAVANLQTYELVVFVSSNGVNHFLDRVTNLSLLNSAKIVAIGKATQAQLHSTLGNQVEILVPDSSNSDSVADLITNESTQTNSRVLIIRANRGSNVLSDRLEKHNSQTDQEIQFDEVVAYQSLDVEVADPTIENFIIEGKIDWITLTSSAIARSALKLFGESIRTGNSHNPKKCKLVSISPTTSQTIRDCGFEPHTEAITYNIDGIVEAISKNQNG